MVLEIALNRNSKITTDDIDKILSIQRKTNLIQQFFRKYSGGLRYELNNTMFSSGSNTDVLRPWNVNQEFQDYLKCNFSLEHILVRTETVKLIGGIIYAKTFDDDDFKCDSYNIGSLDRESREDSSTLIYYIKNRIEPFPNGDWVELRDYSLRVAHRYQHTMDNFDFDMFHLARHYDIINKERPDYRYVANKKYNDISLRCYDIENYEPMYYDNYENPFKHLSYDFVLNKIFNTRKTDLLLTFGDDFPVEIIEIIFNEEKKLELSQQNMKIDDGDNMSIFQNYSKHENEIVLSKMRNKLFFEKCNLKIKIPDFKYVVIKHHLMNNIVNHLDTEKTRLLFDFDDEKKQVWKNRYYQDIFTDIKDINRDFGFLPLDKREINYSEQWYYSQSMSSFLDYDDTFDNREDDYTKYIREKFNSVSPFGYLQTHRKEARIHLVNILLVNAIVKSNSCNSIEEIAIAFRTIIDGNNRTDKIKSGYPTLSSMLENDYFMMEYPENQLHIYIKELIGLYDKIKNVKRLNRKYLEILAPKNIDGAYYNIKINELTHNVSKKVLEVSRDGFYNRDTYRIKFHKFERDSDSDNDSDYDYYFDSDSD